MKSALVTGATGFIGRHLIARLMEDGWDVIAAVRVEAKMDVLPRGVQRVAFDLAKPNAIDARAFEGVDCVYHLAARVHVMKPTAQDEQSFMSLNVGSSAALARAAAKAGVPKFVYLSSIKVNGERTTTRPFRIEDPPAPQDAYGRSKWQAECALEEIADSDGLSVAVVRPPLVYGPGVGANFAKLLALVFRGWPLPLAGIDNRRSLVSVWNLTDLLVRVARESVPAKAKWLVSDDDDVSTARLVRLIADAMGRPSRMWKASPDVLRKLAAMLGRRAEVDRLVDSLQVDISQTCDSLKWRPPITLEDGIARTAKWYLETRRGPS